MSTTEHQARHLKERALNEMRKNFDEAVDGMPRWRKRLSDKDRDCLVQALSDLELLLGIVG